MQEQHIQSFLIWETETLDYINFTASWEMSQKFSSEAS